MAKYSRALDLVTTSIRLAQKGKMSEAAKCFEHALKAKDLEATMSSLETQQAAAFKEVQKANPTLATLFTEIAAKKKTAAKKKVKAKPFGGKAAPPFKKKSKAKASEGDDEGEEESGIDDELDPVLDEMTADDLSGDDGVNVVDGDDLSLEDLDGLLDDDGVEEMPEANVTAGEGDDEGEEESSEDDGEDDSEEESSDDEEDEKEEESAPAQTAKVKTVASNLQALDRLRKSKTLAGAKKPAK